jgi:predicted PurR-regulated permease PerM
MRLEPVSDGEQTRGTIERWTGTAAVAILALACLLILRPFISAALWAAILCFTTWPLFTRLTAELDGRRTLAASLATLLLSAIIIAPVAILVSRLAGDVAAIIEASRKLIHEGPPAPPTWLASVPLVGPRLAAQWSLLSEGSAEQLAAVAKWLPTVKDVVLGSGRALAAGLFQIVLSLLMVFLFYCDGETVANRLNFAINRIGGAQGIHLLKVAGTTIRAIVYGVLGTALLQGLLASAGFIIARVPGAVLLGFLTFVVAVFPGGPVLVGAFPVFWLYRHGSVEWAIFIATWVVIVSSLDHLVRPFLISRGGGNTPLILVVLGVLGGAMAFGLIGLFLGPTLLAVGYSMVNEWSSDSARLLLDGGRKSELSTDATAARGSKNTKTGLKE